MTPEGFVKEMRLAAAVTWYVFGLLSQSKAAEVAGVTRNELLEALSRFKVPLLQTTPERLVPRAWPRLGVQSASAAPSVPQDRESASRS